MALTMEEQIETYRAFLKGTPEQRAVMMEIYAMLDRGLKKYHEGGMNDDGTGKDEVESIDVEQFVRH